MRALLILAGIGLAAFGAAQLQHLFWSTARVENQSHIPIEQAVVVVEGERIPLGVLGPGEARFLRLPKRGDATLTIELTLDGKEHHFCSEYVEGDMYHVRVYVTDGPDASCETSLGIFHTRVMLLEML